jgi:hypothetical protein
MELTTKAHRHKDTDEKTNIQHSTRNTQLRIDGRSRGAHGISS